MGHSIPPIDFTVLLAVRALPGRDVVVRGVDEDAGKRAPGLGYC